MSKRALKVNAYVLSLTHVVQINRKDGSSSFEAIGSLHKDKCRHVSVLSFSPVVEKNS